MRDGDLTYNDFLQRLNIQDVLIDAGYHLNKRDGLRYPSYVRLDSDGRRIRGDKFIVTQQGKCCFHAQQQKVYNIISFIKEHPHFFTEYHAGMAPDRLVNLVCNRLLHHPITERETRIIRPKQDVKPFDMENYDVHKFNPQDRATQKKFYPFFKHRGIDLYTQYAFHRHFYLTTKHREDGLRYTNLSFPLTLPKDTTQIVGLEERGRPRVDDGSSYKGKAEGSNSSEGLWIASPAKTSLTAAKHIYWFESAYDAMAYYQLHQAENKELRKAVFISTGGAPSQQQFKGMIKATPDAAHHICFDRDRAGQVYAIHFALTHAGKSFSTCLSKDDKLIVQDYSNGNKHHEIGLEPFDFKKITATLGIDGARPNTADSLPDDMEIGDGYLQEMSMVRMDEYEMARADGSASEEELEAMRNNLAAIDKAINAFGSSPKNAGCVLYESAAEDYKDWNDQLLDKRIKPKEKEVDDWDISGKATLNRALADLPEVNPEHIRNGLYDEMDHEAVRKRLERADSVIFSFETNDRGMPEKGFQEMYEIREALARLEIDITNSLSGMRESYNGFHR
ncbi:toprim domain-containing protein [Bacteroides fragilis]|nr:toprim domain-containing protein [Bacteroides fragilis]MCS2878757.1 toprim domain-containing protein [Bacteroides fragilis]